jgi:hypothetical protein
MDQPSTPRRQPPTAPKASGLADKFEVIRYLADSAVYELWQELTARLDDQDARIATLMEQVESANLRASMPQAEHDRKEAAKVAKELKVPWGWLTLRGPDTKRGAAVATVFRALRQRGLSVDRIAVACSYSPRGVSTSLKVYAPKP